MSAATATITASEQRLAHVKALWARSQKEQLEIGRLLYEEREERIGVGGRGHREGFQQWLREAGIPVTSAYRRIAEYEVSIGVRAEEPEDKPVPSGTTILQQAINREGKETLWQLRAAIDARLKPRPEVKPEDKCEKPIDEPFATCFLCGTSVHVTGGRYGRHNDPDLKGMPCTQRCSCSGQSVGELPDGSKFLLDEKRSRSRNVVDPVIELKDGQRVRFDGTVYKVSQRRKDRAPILIWQPEDNE